MAGYLLLPRSSVKGVSWPAILPPPASALLALQFQLEQSQWWSPEDLRQQQFRQLETLLSHAAETVPFYRKHFASVEYNPDRDGVTPEMWNRLPFLRRDDIQSAGHDLLSRRLPPDHGKLLEHFTSGSMGKPIHAFGSEVTHFFWSAMTLRDHLWHKRDLTGKLAVIRTTAVDGLRKGWGPSTDVAFDTGECATLNIRADLDAQVEWLVQQDPDYLLSHPSNIRALTQRCLDQRIRLKRLREVRSFGETLGADLRDLCNAAWGVPLVDTYSAEEVGYIALQCPQHEHYHVQAESVLVEVLDDQGKSCPPGEIGRVVLTPLHNFAMPLIRYEIGDYAEVSEPCPCGRGLPVLKRIMGRQRNLLTLPDGRQRWPSFPSTGWLAIAPIRQFQLIQEDLHTIRVRIVCPRPLTAQEEDATRRMLADKLGHPFHFVFEYPASIEPGSNHKYEDFMSRLA
ncbi:MAG TPA: hypothetical protein VMW07_02110 [Gallionella sp.]|nr:hypothetical protein [Gallionella sp.]